MQHTTKLNLKKPDLTDYVNIADINENMDILDDAVGELKEGSTVIPELETVDKTLAGAINEIDNTLTKHLADGAAHGIGNKSTLLTTNKTTIVDAVNELFTNVSDGKSLVGTAITDVDNSLVVPTEPTFQQLVDLIESISTGKKWASGSSSGGKQIWVEGLNRNEFEVTNIGFSPSIIIVGYGLSYVYTTFWNVTDRSNCYIQGNNIPLAKNNLYVTGDSFLLPSHWSSSMNWIAYE